MSGQCGESIDRTQCTDKTCMGEATYALWMGANFSRVADPHPSYSYDDGDLHPHVCQDCLPRYRDLHGDKGEFIRPEEKLVADGGTSSGDIERVPKAPKTEYGMRYCRKCGWVEAVCGYHPEYGPGATCPNCGPHGPAMFRNRQKLVDYDHESAVLRRSIETNTDTEAER